VFSAPVGKPSNSFLYLIFSGWLVFCFLEELSGPKSFSGGTTGGAWGCGVVRMGVDCGRAGVVGFGLREECGDREDLSGFCEAAGYRGFGGSVVDCQGKAGVLSASTRPLKT